MDGQLTRSVRAAAVAGWWTLLIGVAWYAVGWLVWLVMMCVQPEWLRTLWGGGELTWPAMKELSLWYFGAIKVGLLGVLLLTVWLTLWARQLRRSEAGGGGREVG